MVVRRVCRWASCCGPRGKRLCALRACRRAWRAVVAAWGREGWVLEVRKVWKERWEVEGSVKA